MYRYIKIMRYARTYFFIIIVLVAATVGVVRFMSGEDNWICVDGTWVMHGKPSAPKPLAACPIKKPQKEETMKLTSPVFGEMQQIPVDYSCRGKGLRPTLEFSGIPQNTKSLALTMDDPDAPVGTFHHWLIWNIPITTEISETSLPQGAVVGTNSTGHVGYVTPCPPSGTHRYIFTLYALDSMLNLPTASDSKVLQTAVSGHSMAQTTLTGTFGN
jgi:Raf kinase inhibitor-like YbhB/YbcL family protein